ncbi:MAG: RcnB family protein [Thermohalobaculum sp.]|nr:RcnB family protein [Thermohalobaculum sp.]
MSVSRAFAAVSLALAGALFLLPSGATAAGRDAVAGVSADIAVPAHAGQAALHAKDGRGDRRADRRDDRQDSRHDRRDDRQDYRHDRRDDRADRRQDRREYRADRRDGRHADREGYRDGGRDYRYRNRWGYRPGYHVPRERYVVIHDYGYHGYRRPPYGHGYVRIDGDVFLVALATGLIISAIAY